MQKFHYINGYVLVYLPDHPRAFKKYSSGHRGYVYEHILVAERLIGRGLRKVEVVHHLDFDRSNNNPKNLLILEKDQHNKLHAWIENGLSILGKPRLNKTVSLIRSHGRKTHKDYTITKIRRCVVCKFPLADHLEYTCSSKCNREYNSRNSGFGISRLTKKKLVTLLKSNSWCALGRLFGVSDNAVRQWAVKLGIDPKTKK